ncbi:MAG: radical SAM protein, partial [Candidatus Hydrogenedentes bacterium]|nr:radical SAM protein [Candidatus Hydrogenedentota bacterium]
FFERAVSLIERLKGSGFGGLRLSMTVSRHNIDQLVGVAGLAQRFDLELGVIAAHPAHTHLGVDKTDTGPMPARLGVAFGSVVGRWLRSWSPKQWLRGHFLGYTYRYLTGCPMRFRCRAGEDFFFLQADGTVYHCSVQGRKLGDITTDDWEQIWGNSSAADARRFARHCTERCWMICTARSVYRTKWWKIIAWILVSKLLAHLRLFRLPEPKVVPSREDSSDANPSG